MAAKSAALMVAREITRAADGRLTVVNIDACDLARDSQYATSLGTDATLVAVPFQRADTRAAGFGRELVEQLHRLVRVPVLAAPSGSVRAGRPKSIVAVLDGSPSSLPVLATAASLARPLGARLTVLHVGPQSDRPAAGSWASAREWIDVTAERLRAIGISAIGRATLGNSVGAIESVANAEQADIVVVGADTQSDRPRLALRPKQLLRRSRRPLLLVRADACVDGGIGRLEPEL